jgi:fatty-acyl-CoA synthase
VQPVRDKFPVALSHPTQQTGLVNLAHVYGAKTAPLIHRPIGLFFDEQASKYSSKELVSSVHQNIRLSWTDVKNKADAFAAGLLKLGFKKGHKLAVWLPNAAEYLICQIATAKIGVVLVTMNPSYKLYELDKVMNIVDVQGIVIQPQLRHANYIEMINEFLPELKSAKIGTLEGAKAPSLRYVIHTGTDNVPGMLKFDDVLNNNPNDVKQVTTMQSQLHYNEPINIQFTSGTTGFPKAALLSHANILNNGYFVGKRMHMTPNDVIVTPVPLFHCFGYVMSNLAAVTHGAKLVYPSDVFSPNATLKAVQDEKGTVLQGVPTMFIAELEDPEFKAGKINVSSLRSGIMAGAPCPIEIMKRVMNEMHMKEVTICYGMTETSPVSFQTEISDSVAHRVETVGRIQDYLEAKVVDKYGTIVPTNTTGELCVKGYSVMLGYYNKNAHSSIDSDMLQAKDGWMHTGDLVTFDDDGYCRIVGRNKDVIIRGGENIFPREIEEILHKHKDIAEVHVCGVPDQKYGELVCAWIKVKHGATVTEDQVKEFCKQQKISSYKIPNYILFVEHFPTTQSGKIQKYKMREASIEIFHLKEQNTTN